jgi:hypothetical protein
VAILSRDERALVHSIAPHIVPGVRALSAADREALLDLIDVALSDRTADDRRQFALFLRLLRWLPLVRYGRRLDALAPPQQLAVLRYVQDCPVQLVRCGFWGLRTLILLGYYGRPEAAGTIGYSPSPHGNAVLHARARR